MILPETSHAEARHELSPSRAAAVMIRYHLYLRFTALRQIFLSVYGLFIGQFALRPIPPVLSLDEVRRRRCPERDSS